MPEPDLTLEHIQANASALAHYADFDAHRNKLTALAIDAAPRGTESTLCVLGAGNCFDLDLSALATHYAEIHLVDIDQVALARTIARQEPATQAKLSAHAPIDVSGLFERIERWSRFEVTPEELMSHGARTAALVRERVGLSFDVVLSACMLSQMQLSVVRVLGDTHPLFQAVRLTLTLTHFRTLAELTKEGGRVLFATDVSADPLYPLKDTELTSLSLLKAAVEARKVFDFADPERVCASLADDPVLRRTLPHWNVKDAWLWTNGPETTFLVYACELPRF